MITIEKRFERAHPNEPYPHKLTVVETSQNFSSYVPDSFERYFTSIITEETYFTLNAYIKKVYLNIESSYKFKKLIIAENKLDSLFKKSGFTDLFKIFAHNSTGELHKQKLKTYLYLVSGNIKNWLVQKPARAAEALGILKGNIFLLAGFNSDLVDIINANTQLLNRNNGQIYFENFLLENFTEISCHLGDDFISEFSHAFDTATGNFDFSDGGGDWGDCGDAD